MVHDTTKTDLLSILDGSTGSPADFGPNGIQTRLVIDGIQADANGNGAVASSMFTLSDASLATTGKTIA